ncbi:MAG: FAD-binding oxidoreductase [Actinomycetota bacterium]|nr:FAD-binding oxidoreductase [Actinomycetota bacterium]
MDEPGEADRRSYAEAEPGPWWLSGGRPEPHPSLDGPAQADLVVVGGGLTGLWAAIIAKQRDPGRDVVLIERETLAIGASGRNGGFMSSSLVHGIGNGLARFPDEVPELERLGLENLESIRRVIAEEEIECDLISSGAIEVAFTDTQFEELREATDELRQYGHEAVVLDAAGMRGELNSPLFRGGLWQKSGECLVDPVKLCDGLAELALRLGVRIHEGTTMTGLDRDGAGVEVTTSTGSVRAGRALLATAAFRSPVRAIRHRVIPVYDYVLVTEPLSAAQVESIGWDNRQGFSDSANQFHYYRPIDSPEGLRILWGGYDAIYNYGGRVEDSAYQRNESFAGLAQRFFTAFPQLEGLRFSHRWGGAIDTCSRFFAFYGTAHRGRTGWAVGHTGLGVGASRFSAAVGLDILDGHDTPVTRMKYARSRPVPFPPEPLRWAVVQFTRNRLAAADRKDGRRGLWLKTLDRLGLGFDS